MSWAAENPEKYDEILREGVVDKIESQLKANGFDCIEGRDHETICAVVEILQQETSGATIHNAVSEAEGDYMGSRADY